MDQSDGAELLYKVLVVGDVHVGKTSIIKRYVHNLFSSNYRSTIGVDFGLKELFLGSTIVRVQLWDIAGQERFGNLTRVYYKEAVGALVVFDLSRRDSMEAAAKWKADIDHKVFLPDGSHVPCVLCANKCDLPRKDGPTDEEIEEFCHKHNFAAWYETSAKTNVGIDAACHALVQRVVDRDLGSPNSHISHSSSMLADVCV